MLMLRSSSPSLEISGKPFSSFTIGIELKSCYGGNFVNFCENHPDRDAMGKCIRCGKMVCYECAYQGDGPTMCIACASGTQQRGSSWDSEPSPWDQSPYMDGQVQNHLNLGMIAGLLWIITAIFALGQNWLIMNNMYGTLYVLTSVGLIGIFLGFMESIFLAIGFNGLYLKYSEPVCRYALYANLASLGLSVFNTLLIPMVYSMNVFYFLSVIFIVVFVITIVTGYAFWKIRDSSTKPNLTSLTGLVIIGTVPFSLVTSLAAYIWIWGILLPSAFSIIVGVLLLLTFKFEKGMSPKAVISKW